MKKWLRKTSPSPSSYALPISWVSKFKKQRESPGKEKKQASRSDSKDSAVAAEHQLGSQDKWQKVEDAEARKATSDRNEKELQMSKYTDIGGGSRERAEHKKKEVRAAGLESFAVAKHSQDPQQDFRDSMMDMIAEMGIKKPEKMEELLASYLTLNADEYHDLIIKVFKQVWHELDDMRILNLQLQQLSLVFDN